ncbi:hypothetical protein [Nitrosomonas oligotropha]|uniref:hypothetical protein n=1 Tax=Nitrosomonas oligotropha TaxID=42354 RepID=UPI00136CAD5B|nr:hypothetical protein [Nitrosomonas oligotropha]MXS84168.1 hypothetical protein [Nitrosomonas oligotropha]
MNYQLNDINGKDDGAQCSAVLMPGGKYRAEVRVAGHKFLPPLKSDYIYQSEELFEGKSAAIHFAQAHFKQNFPCK